MRKLLLATTILLCAAGPVLAVEPYEIRQGFDDLAPKGPSAALGLVIWNHGVSGQSDQGAFPPPAYVRQLAQAGWDVIRIKRDGLQESNWATAGLRHVARTVEEVQKAREGGYRRIVLAGQSYGGAITLEAARRIEVYAIVPSAPGTGVSLIDLGSPMTSAQGTQQLLTALAEGKFERAVPILPFADEYSASSPERGRKAREALGQRGLPFLPLDEASTQLVGHSASGTAMMSFAYGACVVAFLDPAAARPARQNACGDDGLPPSPDILKETADLKPMKGEGGTWWQSFQGVWVGAWSDPVLVSLAIEKGNDGPELVYLYGKRSSAELGRTYRAPAALQGATIFAKLPHQDVTLSFDQKTRQVVFTWRNAEGKSGSLRLRSYAPAG